LGSLCLLEEKMPGRVLPIVEALLRYISQEQLEFDNQFHPGLADWDGNQQKTT